MGPASASVNLFSFFSSSGSSFSFLFPSCLIQFWIRSIVKDGFPPSVASASRLSTCAPFSGLCQAPHDSPSGTTVLSRVTPVSISYLPSTRPERFKRAILSPPTPWVLFLFPHGFCQVPLSSRLPTLRLLVPGLRRHGIRTYW